MPGNFFPLVGRHSRCYPTLGNPITLMKTLLVKMIVCSAALLPMTQVQAADPGGRNYYGLAPGKEFTLKVTSVFSTKESLSGTSQTKVPTGIPKFSKGQNITLKIGSNGELKGPGFSTLLKSASRTDSVYQDKLVGSNLPDTAVVRKNSRLKPIFTELIFYKTTNVGTMNQTVYMVVYTLQ